MIVDWTIRRPLSFSRFMISLSATWPQAGVVSSPFARPRDSAAHLDVLPLKVGHLVGKPAGLVDRARRHLVLGNDAVGDGDAVVVLAERGRLVDDARSGSSLYIVVADDAERLVLELGGVRRGAQSASVATYSLTPLTCSVK